MAQATFEYIIVLQCHKWKQVYTYGSKKCIECKQEQWVVLLYYLWLTKAILGQLSWN